MDARLLPGESGRGIRTISDADLRAAADWARANGVQLACHAMGDAALDLVIDTLGGDEPWLGEVPSFGSSTRQSSPPVASRASPPRGWASRS